MEKLTIGNLAIAKTVAELVDEINALESQKAALLAACKKLIEFADNSLEDDIDSSGWTESILVSRKRIIAIESAIEQAGESGK